MQLSAIVCIHPVTRASAVWLYPKTTSPSVLPIKFFPVEILVYLVSTGFGVVEIQVERSNASS